tara:strand:+ start:116 stop:487 length:372 start_codon:yes stop_codon:yes gene_type:complete
MTKYEDIVKDICLTTWKDLQTKRSVAEMDGWIGVSAMLAFIKGVEPTPQSMSYHFGEPPNIFEMPLRRLIRHGAFTDTYNAKEDKVLLGEGIDPMMTKRAYCIIAGVASGFVGAVDNKPEFIN